jgi:hypothetical protein
MVHPRQVLVLRQTVSMSIRINTASEIDSSSPSTLAATPKQLLVSGPSRFVSEEAGVPESPLRGSFNDERGSSSEWGPILAFIVLVNAVGWLACLLLRSAFAAGHLWAFFTFVFVTVWSPIVIALALSFSFEGTSGVRNLLGFLFRGFSKNNLWYLIGILVPVAAVALRLSSRALALRCRFPSACGSASYPWATSLYWRNGRGTGMERLPSFSP